MEILSLPPRIPCEFVKAFSRRKSTKREKTIKLSHLAELRIREIEMDSGVVGACILQGLFRNNPLHDGVPAGTAHGPRDIRMRPRRRRRRHGCGIYIQFLRGISMRSSLGRTAAAVHTGPHISPREKEIESNKLSSGGICPHQAV